jgi:hypothetical protein
MHRHSLLDRQAQPQRLLIHGKRGAKVPHRESRAAAAAAAAAEVEETEP